MIEVKPADVKDDRCRLWVRPNPPLSRDEMRLFLIFASIGSLGFASVFAVQGLWLPLPFVGIELIVLAMCFSGLQRKGKQFEEYELDADRLSVTQSDHTGCRTMDFHPAWVKVELRSGSHRWYPRRLFLCAHGTELEVGTFLTDEERNKLALELKKLTAPVSVWS